MTWTLEDEQVATQVFIATRAALLYAARVKSPSCNSERAVILRRLLKDGPRLEARMFALSRTQFIHESHGLCVATAKILCYGGVEHEELVALGDAGLVDAIDYWEPRPGIRFAAYAVGWIRKWMLQRLQRERKLQRARGAVAEDVCREVSYEIDLETARRRRRLITRLATLNPKTREILGGLYGSGHTQKDVGAAQGIHERSVYRIQRRALRNLRAAIGRDL